MSIPKYGKVYRLTGASGTPCVANGNTWEESIVHDYDDDYDDDLHLNGGRCTDRACTHCRTCTRCKRDALPGATTCTRCTRSGLVRTLRKVATPSLSARERNGSIRANVRVYMKNVHGVRC